MSLMSIRDAREKYLDPTGFFDIGYRLENATLQFLTVPSPNDIYQQLQISNANDGFIIRHRQGGFRTSTFLEDRKELISSMGNFGVEFLEETGRVKLSGAVRVFGSDGGVSDFIISEGKDGSGYVVLEIIDGQYVRKFYIKKITDFKYTENLEY